MLPKKLQSRLELQEEAKTWGTDALCLKDADSAADSRAGHIWPCAPCFAHLFCLHTQRGSDAEWHHCTWDILISVSLGPCKEPCMFWKIHKYIYLNAVILPSANSEELQKGEVPKWSTGNYYPLSTWGSWFLSLEKGRWERKLFVNISLSSALGKFSK